MKKGLFLASSYYCNPRFRLDSSDTGSYLYYSQIQFVVLNHKSVDQVPVVFPVVTTSIQGM